MMASSPGGVKAPGAMGIVSKLNSKSRIKTKWPSTAKNTKVHSTVKNWPIIGALVPETGSTKEAKPKPVCIATAWPASTKHCAKYWVIKPIPAPITTCEIVVTMPKTEKD